MGFILDGPSRMARNMQERVDSLYEYAQRECRQLNETLNGLDSTNFREQEARALSAMKESASAEMLKKLSQIAGELGGIRNDIANLSERVDRLERGG